MSEMEEHNRHALLLGHVLKHDEMLGHSMNGVVVALALLVKQFEKSGSLNKGEYRDALRNTVDAATCEPDRPDLGLLAHLADYLDGKLDNMPAVQ